MPTRLRALTLVSFILWSGWVAALGQEPVDDLAFPPLVEEFAIEDEAGETYESNLWISPIIGGTTGAVNEYLRQGHVYSAVDFAMLSQSDEAFETDGDFVVSPRFQLGWESETGFGVRGRWWEYENEVSYPVVDRTINSTLLPGEAEYSAPQQPRFASRNEGRTFELSTENYELDLYQRFLVGNTAITIGGGLKTIDEANNSYITDAVTFAGNQLFTEMLQWESEKRHGTGPSFFAELERPVVEYGNFELSFVMVGRTSFIPADYEYYVISSTPQSIDDDLWINEGTIGLELLRRYQDLTLRMRSQFETQYWNSAVTDNQAFTGASVSFGVDW